MNIQDFDKHLEGLELEKGFTFYKVGCLEAVEEKKVGQWQTTVRGSEYQVTVQVKDNAITKSSCSCTANIAYCRHIIATLYTIAHGVYSAENTEVIVPPTIVIPKEKKVKESFADLVNKIDISEIREFVVTYAGENKMFKNEFHAHFSDKSVLQGRDAYAKIVQRAINSNSSVRYSDIRNSLKPVETLLEKADDALGRKEYTVTVDIAFAVIDKVQDLVVITRGETRGGIGDCIEGAFGLLNEVVSAKISNEVKKHVFIESLSEASSGKYKGHWNEGYWKPLLVATAYNAAMKKMMA